MSRQLRIWYPGAIYHIMSRGNWHYPIFRDEEDKLHFLEIVKKAQEEFHFKIHSICLMTNHFHMEMETADDEIWTIMQKILHTYCMDFNAKYDLKGHLFQSRYLSSIIENVVYFLEVNRYIHLNPVRAGLVDKPVDYEFSSYGLYYPNQSSIKTAEIISDIVETSRVLESFSGNPKEQYRIFVEGRIPHTEHEIMIRKVMKEDDLWMPW